MVKPFVCRGVAILVTVAFVAACGGGGGGGADGDVECVDVPAAELGVSGALCSDTGLRPDAGGFSFENWGGLATEDAINVTTAIAIFGEDEVCAQKTDAGCIPLPAVQHWIEGANSQIAGGRCEGMAVLSQRIHDGGDLPAQLQEQAARTVDLRKETPPVAASISRWWVSQGFEAVIQATKRAWELEPSEVVAKIDAAIKADAGATIGIYANGMGHAVTPIAVTLADDGTYAISVYDNNYPGEVTVLSVDPETETWTYDVGAANSGTVASKWSGGKSSIDYVVMADREGRQNVPWSDSDRDERSKGSARITISTGGRSLAGLVIKVGGDTIDTRDLSTMSNGIAVYPNRGGIGTGAMVEIPGGLADVKIEPVVGDLLDPSVSTVDLAVTIDAPGPGSQFVTDTVEGDELTRKSYGQFSLNVSTDEKFETSLDVAADGKIGVGVAYEEEAAQVMLEDGQNLNVVDDAGLAVEVTTAEGKVAYEVGFDGQSDSGEIGVTNVDVDEVTGEVVVEVEPTKAETVNDEILAITGADGPAAGEPNYGPADPRGATTTVAGTSTTMDVNAGNYGPADPRGATTTVAGTSTTVDVNAGRYGPADPRGATTTAVARTSTTVDVNAGNYGPADPRGATTTAVARTTTTVDVNEGRYGPADPRGATTTAVAGTSTTVDVNAGRYGPADPRGATTTAVARTTTTVDVNQGNYGPADPRSSLTTVNSG